MGEGAQTRGRGVLIAPRLKYSRAKSGGLGGARVNFKRHASDAATALCLTRDVRISWKYGFFVHLSQTYVNINGKTSLQTKNVVKMYLLPY